MGGVTLHLLLVSVFIAGVGSTCFPTRCLKCNTTEETAGDPCELCSDKPKCINKTSEEIPSNCKKEFQANVKCNGSKFEEGDDITLQCDHNLPTLPGMILFSWKREGKRISRGKNESELFLKKVLSHDSGHYVCVVRSACGKLESLPHEVTVNNNNLVILVICGVSALVLVVIMGVAMKYKIKRDNEKHKERMRQKAELEQSSNPDPFTPRDPK